MKHLTLYLFTLILIPCVHAQALLDTDAIIRSEFIYQKNDVPFPSCHASTIVETSQGLVAAWFGGTHEKHPDVEIWLSRQESGKWTIPAVVATGIQNKKLRYPCWNPVLFFSGKEILLFYKVGPSVSEWWGEMKTSADLGKSWSKAKRLPEGIFGPIKNKPVLLRSGVLLCPSSSEVGGWKVQMESTLDWGVSWEKTEALNDGKTLAAIQPTILQHKNGDLQILCRTKSDLIYSSWSKDNGKFWTRLEPTVLPNPNSGIDAVTLKDGRQLLVYNHINRTLNQGKRNILNVAISKDGLKWDAAVLLEDDQDVKSEYSYPAVIQTGDGLLHITYTWNRKLIKHVVLDPSKLGSKPMTNGNWPKGN